MKVTLAFLCLALVALSPVAQGNYLLQAYDEATEMMTLYREEAFYFSNYLVEEATHMGTDFTDLVATAVARATSAAQGEAIRSCASTVHYLSWSNVNYMALYLLDTGRASDRLHLSVLDQLRTMNIKEYDPELFYYYHGYLMEEAYDTLWYHYSYNMMNAWLNVYLEFELNYGELEYCLERALEN